MPKRISYYTDENVSGAVVNGLLIRGVDVKTAKEAKLLRASDEEHLKFANKEHRIIVTQDSDFLRLHAKGINHNGIIYYHPRTPIGEIIRRLILIHGVFDTNDMKNHIEFI